jgi:Uma2 family endonuclease
MVVALSQAGSSTCAANDSSARVKNDRQPRTVGEQRVVFRGITWTGYLQILAALPSNSGSRLTYDDGLLEITMPLEDHEFCGRLIERFIITLVELLDLDVKTMGSTTINYPQLQKGA